MTQNKVFPIYLKYSEWIKIRNTLIGDTKHWFPIGDFLKRTYGFKFMLGSIHTNHHAYITLEFDNESTATEFKLRYL